MEVIFPKKGYLMSERMRCILAVIGAIAGVIFAALAAPSQIASGIEDWRTVLQSESYERAIDELNK